MNSKTTTDTPKRIKLPRLLLVLLYDSLAIVGLLFLVGIIMLLARSGEATTAGDWWFRGYLVFSVFLYYAWCWNRGGQTLGLKSWRAKVVTMEGYSLNWQTALRRFLGSLLSWLPLGLGYWWILFDKEGLSWHDRLSGSQIILVPKEKKQKKEGKSAQTTN